MKEKHGKKKGYFDAVVTIDCSIKKDQKNSLREFKKVERNAKMGMRTREKTNQNIKNELESSQQNVR